MPNENSYEVALQKSNAIREGLAKTPEKFTMLTGDRPTGRLHLGHYFGTLKGRVELQNMGAKTNVLIADYQVITDRDTTEHIQDNVYNMVMDYNFTAKVEQQFDQIADGKEEWTDRQFWAQSNAPSKPSDQLYALS